jgi:hypothetical protein
MATLPGRAGLRLLDFKRYAVATTAKLLRPRCVRR